MGINLYPQENVNQMQSSTMIVNERRDWDSRDPNRFSLNLIDDSSSRTAAKENKGCVTRVPNLILLLVCAYRACLLT